MVSNLMLFGKYVSKVGVAVKAIFTKPVITAMCVPVMVMPVFTGLQKALIALGAFFVLDFITGIWASYIEFYKNLPPKKPNAPKRYVIKSRKLKLSAVKFIVYGLMLLVAHGIEWAFLPGEFQPHSSLSQMTITTIAAGFLCAIEIYSIVFENFKRMGFDVIAKFRKLKGAVKDFEFKDESGEVEETDPTK